VNGGKPYGVAIADGLAVAACRSKTPRTPATSDRAGSKPRDLTAADPVVRLTAYNASGGIVWQSTSSSGIFGWVSPPTRTTEPVLGQRARARHARSAAKRAAHRHGRGKDVAGSGRRWARPGPRSGGCGTCPPALASSSSWRWACSPAGPGQGVGQAGRLLGWPAAAKPVGQGAAGRAPPLGCRPAPGVVRGARPARSRSRAPRACGATATAWPPSAGRTSAKAPDSAENRSCPGKMKAALGVAGYPVVELMALCHQRWEHELACLALRHILCQRRALARPTPKACDRRRRRC
jgi:hypothetical protein